MDRFNNPYIIPICTPITVSRFTPPLALSNGKSAIMRVMHLQMHCKTRTLCSIQGSCREEVLDTDLSLFYG